MNNRRYSDRIPKLSHSETDSLFWLGFLLFFLFFWWWRSSTVQNIFCSTLFVELSLIGLGVLETVLIFMFIDFYEILQHIGQVGVGELSNVSDIRKASRNNM